MHSSSRSASPSPLSDAGASWDTLTSRLAALQSPAPGKMGGTGGVTNPSSAPMEGFKPPSVPKGDSGDRVSVVLVSRRVGLDICGGRIGTDNMRFCSVACAPGSTSCGRFSSHSTKANVSFPAYYIGTPKQGIAFVSPCLQVPDEGLPSAAVSVLTGKNTIAEWTNAFSVLQGLDKLKSSTQQDLIARLDRSVSLEPTPMKTRRRSALVDLAMSMSEKGDDEELILIDDELEQVLMPDGLEEEEKKEHVLDNWNGLIQATQRQRQAGEDMELNVLDLLEQVDNKVVKVAASLGSKPPVNAPAVTVWDSIGAQTHRLDTIEKDAYDMNRKWENEFAAIDRTVNKQVWPVISQMTTKLEEIAVPALARGPGADPDVMQNLQVLRNTVRQLLEQHKAIEAEVSSLREEVQTIRNQNYVLRRVIDELPKADNNQNNTPSGYSQEEVRAMLGRMQEELAVFRVECDTIRASVDTTIISFGGHHFQSPESYRRFVRDHIPSNYYGFCFDIVSLLECAMDWDRTTGEGLKTLHIIGRAGYTDTQQARIDTSFGVLIPELFGEAIDKTDPTKKMATLKTMEDWDHPSANAGLKSTIDVFITNYKKTVVTQITTAFGGTSVAGLFFMSMIQHTVHFWETFSAWITKYERELCYQSGGDTPDIHKPSVWKLICLMTHAMFVELAIRRGAGKGMIRLGEETDNTIKCAAIMQGTLGAHKFMEELIEAEFVRHPIFASSMVEFLMANKASLATVNAINTRLKKNEEGVRGAQASADKAMQAMKKGAAAPK